MRVVADRIHFRYPHSDRPVLTDLSLDIPPGVSAAVVGPSGSGKTTLLSLLGGLLTPQQGDFCCTDAAGRRHAPADVATWILQTVSLLPDRTVEDNVCLGAYLDGASRGQTRERAAHALDAVGLADRGQERAGLLSGGEGQRVAIARALASRRPVVFADEPTGQLDASTTSSVLDAFFALSPRTVILITHDEIVASRCDLVLHLADGRIARRDENHR